MVLQKPLRTRKRKEKPKPSGFTPTLLFIFLLIFAIKPFIEFDEDGKPKLAEWREEKMIKELEDLEGAEQYVLVARVAGEFPCYSCIASGVNQELIFLEKGEVWKYGTTTKGEKGRYRNWIVQNRLRYLIQFEGTLDACLRQEKIMIYSYPLLPESLNRDFHLIRPAGNKQDN